MSRIARVAWVLLVSPLVSIGIGCLAGALYISVMGVAAGVPLATAIRRLPIAGLYALLVAGPLGVVAGLSGALLILALGANDYRGASCGRWLMAGAVVGGVVGCVVTLFFATAGGGAVGVPALVLFATMTLLACGASGVATAWLGWREFGDSGRAD
jgi:hypothetical protein